MSERIKANVSLEKLIRPIAEEGKLPNINPSSGKQLTKLKSLDAEKTVTKGFRGSAKHSTEVSKVSLVSLNSRMISLPQLSKQASYGKLGSRALGSLASLKQDVETYLLKPSAGVQLSITRKKFECPFTRRMKTPLTSQTSHVGMCQTQNKPSRWDWETASCTK